MDMWIWTYLPSNLTGKKNFGKKLLLATGIIIVELLEWGQYVHSCSGLGNSMIFPSYFY